jgi:hypothetical protein
LRTPDWTCYVRRRDLRPNMDCMSTKQTSEKYFLQGLSSAQGGLSAETCPYAYVPSDQDASVEEICAPVNWSEGWQFGRFVAIERLRKEKSDEVRTAIRAIFQHEIAWSEMLCTVNRGLLKAGLNYFTARRISSRLARQIRQSKEFRLLHDLRIELYLPCRPDEHPYRFKLFDRQLEVFGFRTEEKKLRQLLERYGDRHGIGAAWREYVHAEPIEKMIPFNPLN